MRVVGVDFSSFAIDVVSIDVDDLEPPVWTRFELAGQDAFDRTRQVASVMPKRGSIWWADVLAVGIEHPAGKFGTGSMMRVQGAVLSCLPAGVLVKPWPPGAWRKAAGLPGNCTKVEVALGAVALGAPDEWVTPDSYDAYMIAVATRLAIESGGSDDSQGTFVREGRAA